MEFKNDEAICNHCGYNEQEPEKHNTIYLIPGTILAKQYIVGSVLGQGGFGVTYIGFDKKLHTKVAIKEYFPTTFANRNVAEHTVIPLEGDHKDSFYHGLDLFIKEARNIAKFKHNPNIVNINYYFEEHNTGYMVMDHLEGGDLSKLLKKRGSKLPLEEALQILFPILDALEEVHFSNLYHLDISTQNILFNAKGIPMLIDFGAAKQIIGEVSQSMDVILKRGYAPIEQYATKGNIGPWTDIYACGATLYKMITGDLPPAAPDRILRDELVQPSDVKGLNVSSEFNDTILHALAVRDDDRFKNIQEFKNALNEGTKKKPYEMYQGMLGYFLTTKNIDVGERISLDSFINKHELAEDETGKIEKDLRKERNAPPLNWETEFKENCEQLVKKYEKFKNIPQKEKEKLQQTYLDTNRISEKKAQNLIKNAEKEFSPTKSGRVQSFLDDGTNYVNFLKYSDCCIKFYDFLYTDSVHKIPNNP